MSSLISIQHDAEDKATQQINAVHDRLILLLAGRPIDSISVASIRSRMQTVLSEEIGILRTSYDQEFQEVIRAAIETADSQLKYFGGGTVHTFVSTDEFERMTVAAFGRLRSHIESDVTMLLSRAVLGNLTADTIAEKLNGAMFDSFESKARGIVHVELAECYQYAYNKRITEVSARNEFVQKTKVQSAKDKNAKGDTLLPLTMNVWRHSGGGNPPRLNHVAMHNKGVALGTKFILVSEDGMKTYHTFGPRTAELAMADGGDGIAEVINCHCVNQPVVIWVTQKEKDTITEESQSTGGFHDARWSKF